MLSLPLICSEARVASPFSAQRLGATPDGRKPEKKLERRINMLEFRSPFAGLANGERVHAGEFLRLLRELAPDEEGFYADGAKEVEEELKKM